MGNMHENKLRARAESNYKISTDADVYTGCPPEKVVALSGVELNNK
jgi:hypothetical protein